MSWAVQSSITVIPDEVTAGSLLSLARLLPGSTRPTQTQVLVSLGEEMQFAINRPAQIP